METNPLVPRQRNRRADRQPSEAPVMQPAPPVQQPIAQPPAYPQAPNSPSQQNVRPQSVYPQTPRTMYQQPMAPAQANQPISPMAASYPPMPQHPQAIPSSAPHSQQMQQLVQAQPMAPAQPVQYAPRPRVLNQPGTVNSGWQQPTLHERAEVPHARASRSLSKETTKAAKTAQRETEAKARKEAKPEKKKLPGWLTTTMSLAFIAVLALVAAYYLMQAYLVTEENKRIAAYEAVLDNYHVTEQADGTLQVTWQEHIEKYAAQYNLQPAFVTAIIRNESSFRTNAESSVGARGLMQMMPDTAEWIAGKLDDPGYTFDKMYDAETNIRYGCWYLGYLSRLFHGDPVLVSAAYHAGQTTVTQWLSDRTKSADGVSLDLEKLSDGPTKQYIGRVTQTYGIYQTLLYPDKAFGAADAVSAGSGYDAAADR